MAVDYSVIIINNIIPYYITHTLTFPTHAYLHTIDYIRAPLIEMTSKAFISRSSSVAVSTTTCISHAYRQCYIKLHSSLDHCSTTLRAIAQSLVVL